jgi:thioredoxin-related protein
MHRTLTPALLAAAALAPPVPAAPAQGIDWFEGPWFSAQRKARAEGRGLLVAFRTDGSTWCDRLASESFSDPAVAGETEPYVCLLVDLTRDAGGHYVDNRAAVVAERFPVRVFPSIFFTDGEGRLEDLIAGYAPTASLLAELRRIRAGTGTRTELEQQVARAPEDIAARLRLATKLADLGDLEGQQREMAAIHRLDPEERSVPMRRFRMLAVIEGMESRFDDANGLYETAPLEEFLRAEQHDPVLFEGWQYLSNLWSRLGRLKDACRAARRAWAHVPAAQEGPFGETLARLHWSARDEIGGAAKKEALAVARRMVALAEEAGLGAAQLASLLDVLACCQAMNGDRAAALATLERCIELAPDAEPYRLRRELFRIR